MEEEALRALQHKEPIIPHVDLPPACNYGLWFTQCENLCLKVFWMSAVCAKIYKTDPAADNPVDHRRVLRLHCQMEVCWWDRRADVTSRMHLIWITMQINKEICCGVLCKCPGEWTGAVWCERNCVKDYEPCVIGDGVLKQQAILTSQI